MERGWAHAKLRIGPAAVPAIGDVSAQQRSPVDAQNGASDW